MRENIIALRVRNAHLERGLASKPARTAIRHIRTELTRRGLVAGAREEILHDSLLMLAEVEAAGGDPVEALLGTANVSSFEREIEAFCGEVASECPRLPTALVVLRFFALMLVALSAVFAVHLAYRVGSKPPGGWLPWYMVNLRFVDGRMLEFEVVALPIIYLAVQALSSAVRRNPWPHALPAVATPVLFGLIVGVLTAVGPIELPGGFVLYNPLLPDALFPILERWMIEGIPMMGPFAQSVGTIDYPWMSINIFLGFAAIAAMALVGLAVVYSIERRQATSI